MFLKARNSVVISKSSLAAMYRENRFAVGLGQKLNARSSECQPSAYAVTHEMPVKTRFQFIPGANRLKFLRAFRELSSLSAQASAKP